MSPKDVKIRIVPRSDLKRCDDKTLQHVPPTLKLLTSFDFKKPNFKKSDINFRA